MYCPNCKENPKLCGCTWEERRLASRIIESRRREELAKQGRPVEVNQQFSNKWPGQRLAAQVTGAFV